MANSFDTLHQIANLGILMPSTLYLPVASIHSGAAIVKLYPYMA